jgi:hypothetical protein
LVAISFARPVSHDFLKQGSFLACWQVQSKLATLALFALLAISVWLALVVMLVWSIAATFAYFAARQRGMPDVLATPALPSLASRSTSTCSIAPAIAVPGCWL